MQNTGIIRQILKIVLLSLPNCRHNLCKKESFKYLTSTPPEILRFYRPCPKSLKNAKAIDKNILAQRKADPFLICVQVSK